MHPIKMQFSPGDRLHSRPSRAAHSPTRSAIRTTVSIPGLNLLAALMKPTVMPCFAGTHDSFADDACLLAASKSLCARILFSSAPHLAAELEEQRRRQKEGRAQEGRGPQRRSAKGFFGAPRHIPRLRVRSQVEDAPPWALILRILHVQSAVFIDPVPAISSRSTPFPLAASSGWQATRALPSIR